VGDLRRRRSACLEQPAVERLVRAVVEAAHDVRDPEVDVVDDGRELVRRTPVRAQESDAVEPIAELRARLAMPVRAVALAYRTLVPLDAQPAEVADDLLLPAGKVARGIRVVDPQEHPVAEVPVGDGAEGVADVERAGRARRKTHTLHPRPSLESGPVEAALLAWFDSHGRELPIRGG